MTLKELYGELYNKNKNDSNFLKFYKDFKSFAERVQRRIKELDERPINIDDDDDKDLLQKILVESYNGVASTGPYWTGLDGGLSLSAWRDYIMNNRPFIDCLQDYMKKPDDESYFNKLQANCKYKPSTIINRIAATCTQDVSSAIDQKMFNKIVKILENEQIILPGSVSSKDTWFAKNIELMKIINQQLADFMVDGKPLDSYQKSMFVWQIKDYDYDGIGKKQDDMDEEQDVLEIKPNVKKYIELLKANYNLILTGAPGTGKTYLAKQIAMQMIFEENAPDDEENLTDEQKKQFKEQFAFVQFHPSYDYTDFVEGLRPINDESNSDDNKIGFELKNGIFKDFCAKAKETSGSVDNFKKAWNEFIAKVAEKNGDYEIELKEDKMMKLALSPRGGVKFKFGNFDQSFSKEQCYKGYKGIVLTGLLAQRQAVIKHLKEKFGLKDYSEGTTSNSDPSNEKKYIFVIDEINRGEISKIFGELFFSIDPSYRGKKGIVKTQYQNMIEEGDSFYDDFYVPENVFIIGTMNDIDRSVESFDFAMRRRFTWVEVKAEDNLGMLDKLGDDLKTQAKTKLLALNEEISKIDGLGPAYHIGGAYFLKLENYSKQYGGEEFVKLWEYHLEPLLREYLRGNEKQILDNYIEKLRECVL